MAKNKTLEQTPITSDPKGQAPNAKPWYAEGIRFECQGSGKCCSSHGEFGHVYFSPKDRRAAAKVLKMSAAQFTRKYCHKVDGFYALKDNPKGPDCIFLDGKRCSIYNGRPTQCRTWPFWPEVMNAKSWKKDIESFCPGVNKGQVRSLAEIKEALSDQKICELELNIERLKSL